MTPSQPETTEQKLAAALQLISMLAHSFWQLNARFDALKATVCELHPEVATQLEERIRKEQTASAKEFEKLLQTIEFLRSTISGQVQ